MMANHTRNTVAMVGRKREEAALLSQRVIDTINLMMRNLQEVNFNSVAKAAKVSKATLYGKEELKILIESIRDSDEYKANLDKSRATNLREDKAVALLIVAKDTKIKSLEDEINRLKKELDFLTAKVFEEL